MEIVIIRQDHKPWGIDGHLYINRKRVCDTVEHPTRHKPKGTYSVELDNNPFRHGDGHCWKAAPSGGSNPIASHL